MGSHRGLAPSIRSEPRARFSARPQPVDLALPQHRRARMPAYRRRRDPRSHASVGCPSRARCAARPVSGVPPSACPARSARSRPGQPPGHRPRRRDPAARSGRAGSVPQPVVSRGAAQRRPGVRDAPGRAPRDLRRAGPTSSHLAGPCLPRAGRHRRASPRRRVRGPRRDQPHGPGPAGRPASTGDPRH